MGGGGVWYIIHGSEVKVRTQGSKESNRKCHTRTSYKYSKIPREPVTLI